MPRKPNNATSIADLIFDNLTQMQRWGANINVERITDTVLLVAFEDGTTTVQVRVSRKPADVKGSE